MTGQGQVLLQRDCGAMRSRPLTWTKPFLDCRTFAASSWGTLPFLMIYSKELNTDMCSAHHWTLSHELLVHFVFRRGIQAEPLFVGHCKHEYQGVWKYWMEWLFELFSALIFKNFILKSIYGYCMEHLKKRKFFEFFFLGFLIHFAHSGIFCFVFASAIILFYILSN